MCCAGLAWHGVASQADGGLLESLFRFLAVFVGSDAHVSNPYHRAKMVEVMAAMCVHEGRPAPSPPPPTPPPSRAICATPPRQNPPCSLGMRAAAAFSFFLSARGAPARGVNLALVVRSARGAHVVSTRAPRVCVCEPTRRMLPRPAAPAARRAPAGFSRATL